jgi:hypothetical protein
MTWELASLSRHYSRSRPDHRKPRVQCAPPANLQQNPIVHHQTGRCLDSDGIPTGNAGHANVYTLPCNGNNFQKWESVNILLLNGATIVHHETGRCLDSDGIPTGNAGHANVYTLPCTGAPFTGNGNNFQKWRSP